MASKWEIERMLNTVESAILILLFAALTLQTFRQSRLSYIIGLSLLFLISNLSSLACSFLPLKDSPLPLSVKLFSIALAQASINSGHWWFCFRYLDCSICLPYNIKNEQIPKWVSLAMSGFFFVLMAVQVISPVACCLVVYEYAS
jgi:hypothetical protein